jgi:hypothetical protein
MRWQTLAFPCAVLATLAGCGPKAGTKGETGAVPGTPTDTTAAPAPAPAPSATDTTAMPKTPAESSSKSGMTADTGKKSTKMKHDTSSAAPK